MKSAFSKPIRIVLALLVALALPLIAIASSVDESIVDATAPTGSVTLAPGASGAITINLSVTGRQDGTATFKVYKDWTLSGGTFTGSNPETFTVNPRAAQDPANTFNRTGTVTVASGQGTGTFTLAVGAFDITNSSTTGAKLNAGASSNYAVTVSAPADTTPPDTSITSNPADPTKTTSASFGFTGTDDVTLAASLTFECQLDGSGFSACTSPTSYSALGQGKHTFEVRARDAALNVDLSPAVFSWLIDTTAPSANPSQSPAANSAGWNQADVTVAWNWTDAGGSGIDSANCTTSSTSSGEGTTIKLTASCKDLAGNDGTAEYTVNVDKTAPSVSLVGGPADGSTYYFGYVPAAPTCSASDALSGVDGSCSVSGYSAALGSHTVTATAKDKAGNSASANATYSVLAWTLNGFYQPVDMSTPSGPLVYNTVKNGATVPLKFEVFAGPTELTDVAAVKSETPALVPCDASTTTDDIETTATGGTSLRYDTTAGQFVYNWQTPKTAGSCYRVTVTTLDASALVAYFKLK